MKTALGFIALLLIGFSSAIAQSYEGEGGSGIDPTPPPLPWNDERSIELWVVQTVTAAPPEGGIVTMLKHWPPRYARNDKVGEIWIVPALVKIVMDPEHWDHEMAFCVFHVDTGKSDIAVDFQVPEDKLKDYMNTEDQKTASQI